MVSKPLPLLIVVEAVFVVGGGFAVVDAQLFFEMMHTLVGTPQHTGHIGADFDVIVGLGRFVEHVIVAYHGPNFGRFQVEHHGQFVLGLYITIAELALNDIERGQNRRTLPPRRIEVHPFFNLCTN